MCHVWRRLVNDRAYWNNQDQCGTEWHRHKQVCSLLLFLVRACKIFTMSVSSKVLSFKVSLFLCFSAKSLRKRVAKYSLLWRLLMYLGPNKVCVAGTESNMCDWSVSRTSHGFQSPAGWLVHLWDRDDCGCLETGGNPLLWQWYVKNVSNNIS